MTNNNDKLAEAKKLIKNIELKIWDYCPVMHPTKAKCHYTTNFSHEQLKAWIKDLLAAQDLISYERGREEQRRDDADLLNDYDCTCGRPLGAGKHGNSYVQERILNNTSSDAK